MFKVNNKDTRTTSITPEPAKSYETHPNPVQREKIKLNFHFETPP